MELNPVCQNSPKLIEGLNQNLLDIAFIVEPETTIQGDCETLSLEPMVWVVAKGGKAHERRPVPLITGGEKWSVYKLVKETLDAHNIDWYSEHNYFSYEASLINVREGCSMTILLESDVPDDMDVIGLEHGFPKLPEVAIRLYKNPRGIKKEVEEAANLLKEAFLEES